MLDRPVGPGVPGWRSWMGTLIEDLGRQCQRRHTHPCQRTIQTSVPGSPGHRLDMGCWDAPLLQHEIQDDGQALFSSAELSDPFRDRFKYRCPPLSSYYQPGRIALWTLACRYVGSHTFTATHPPALR